jgi:hypothetical protein
MKRNLIAAVAAGMIVGGTGAAAVLGLSGCGSAGPSASQNSAPATGQSSAPSAGQSSQSGGQAGSEKPPQCVTVEISENSGNGPALWTKWCGTGTNGAAPMKAGTGQLTVDGVALSPANCTQANPCVIVWPRSPQG